jgi:hypothetical protein
MEETAPSSPSSSPGLALCPADDEAVSTPTTVATYIPRTRPRRVIDFILEKYERAKAYEAYLNGDIQTATPVAPENIHPHLMACLSQPFWEQIKHKPEFATMTNHNSLAKELTEAWSSYLKVKKLIERAFSQNEPKKQNEENNSDIQDDGKASNASDLISGVNIFDICCGKGYTSFLLGMMHDHLPQIKRIYAIDKNQKMKMDHLQSLEMIKFKIFDVNSKQFQAWLSRKSTKDSSCKSVMLGVHLCGELSELFVSLYNKHENVMGMVLSPCCLPKRNKTAAEKAKRLKVNNYTYWSMHLHQMIAFSSQSTTELTRDDDVLSEKNAYITAYRRRFY